FYGSPLSPLNVTCNELHELIANESYSDSGLDGALLIVDRTSPAFKTLVESEGDQVFEYFIESFCKHLERSDCDLPVHLVESSVYMYLLADYVCFMMPVDSTVTHRGNRVDKLTRNISPVNISISSPLRLFNEDALQRYSISPTKNSLRTLRSFSQSLSPHFISFTCIVMNSLCSLSSWPSEYRLCALRYVLKQYHVFVLAWTDSGVQAQVKLQLLHNPPFVDQLYNFIHSMFAKWPDNLKFVAMFEVWITWIRPWRYLRERTDEDAERVQSFIDCNRRFYTDVTDVFFNRLFILDSPESVHALHNYLTVIVSEPLQKAYKSLKYDLEKPIMRIGAVTAKWAEYTRNLLSNERDRLNKQNWLSRFVHAAEDEAYLQKMQSTLAGLNALTDSISSAASTTAVMLMKESVTVPHYVLKLSPSSSPFTWKKPLPDHYVDTETKFMYLTPLGRKQVRRGTHRFDFSQCLESIPPLVAQQRSDEVWWLAKLLYRLSCTLNRTSLLTYLSKVYYDYSLAGAVARRLLDPEYPHIVVPAFTNTVHSMKPAINLRRFAKYRYVTATCILILLLFFMPSRFAFAIFCPWIGLAALS
uniref:Sphingomyelin phosphodiesterase 4 n=1 Tax=Parascaris univalens TaxID=6257 RepID=A0A915BGH6_PARUN